MPGSISILYGLSYVNPRIIISGRYYHKLYLLIITLCYREILDMEQQTGSKQEKEFVKAVYCHPAYLTYMQSTS